jgi:hypothetical protein
MNSWIPDWNFKLKFQIKIKIKINGKLKIKASRERRKEIYDPKMKTRGYLYVAKMGV